MRSDSKPLYAPRLRGLKKAVRTQDGTWTLYSSEFDECYHSTRDGALRESLSKHVVPAFTLLGDQAKELTILDVCFGLGYNTWSTLYYLRTRRPELRLKILSPEFDGELLRSLRSFEYPEQFDFLRPIIESVSQTGSYRNDRLEIRILPGDARRSLERLEERVDLVYQDPFSPKKNPLLWTREYFVGLKRIASRRMVLTTYSSATAVRMGLYEAGFLLYLPPKSEVRSGTIASTVPLKLEPIDMELKKARNPAAASLRDRDYPV